MKINKILSAIFNISDYKAIPYLIITITIFLFSFSSINLINSDHYDIDGIESYFVQSIERNANGGNYYNDSYAFPYYKFVYTPLYFILGDGVNNMINDNSPNTIEHVLTTYKSYRLVSYFFTVLSFLLLFLIMRKYSSNRIGFFIGCYLIFISALIIPKTAIAVRPDSLASFLFLLVIYLMQKVSIEKRMPMNLIAIISFIAISIFFAKQTSIACLLVVPAYLFLHKRFRDLFFYCAFSIMGLAFFIGVFYLAYGFPFIQSCFLIAANNFDLSWGIYALSAFLFTMSIIIIVPSLILSIDSFLNLKFELFAVAALLLFCVDSLFIFKHGSWINYYVEFIFISILLINFSIVKSNFNFDSKSMILSLHIVFVLFGSVYLVNNHIFKSSNKLIYALSQAEKNEINEVVNYLKIELKGNEYYFSTSEFINTTYSTHLLYPYTQQHKSYENKILPDLKKHIENNELKFFISENDTPPINFFSINFINNYSLVKRIGKYRIYSSNS